MKFSTYLLMLSIFVTSCTNSLTGVVSTKEVGSPTPSAATSPSPAGTKRVSVLSPKADRTVYLVGEVGSNAFTIADQITRLGQESKEPIYLVEVSPGGSVLAGGQIIAAMESSPAPVYTICHILCASMAAMIFEYGTQRYVGDRTFLMFHPAAGSAEGELDKMISRMVSMQRYIGKMEAYAGTKANLTFEQYKAKASVENWIDGEDAVNSGFADHIATVYLPKNSPLSGTFGAKAIYDAIFTRSYTNLPTQHNWIVRPEDLKWLRF